MVSGHEAHGGCGCISEFYYNDSPGNRAKSAGKTWSTNRQGSGDEQTEYQRISRITISQVNRNRAKIREI